MENKYYEMCKLMESSGFAQIADNWGVLLMLLIGGGLLYLAIAKKYEPLLLIPVAFGMILTNLPGAGLFNASLFEGGAVQWNIFVENAGLLDYLYLGVQFGIYPCLILIGLGAMTDFSSLIARPKYLILGAAAQLGIFVTYLCATGWGFTPEDAAAIGIIGGADGSIAIFLTPKLAPELLVPVAIVTYFCIALMPVIQPPVMKLLTSDQERAIEMKPLRTVSKAEKIIFPILVTVVVSLLLPKATTLIASLMLGNLMRECGVVERLAKTVQNGMLNIITVFLGVTIGAAATAENFLEVKTLIILALGFIAFICGTAGGVLFAKVMNLFSKDKINPLIGSAGVSAMPMGAHVSQSVGQETNSGNFLLTQAMGPNAAGIIAAIVVAGFLLSVLG